MIGCASCPLRRPGIDGKPIGGPSSWVGGEWARETGDLTIAVIGISPWRQEMKQGHPFVGPAGKLVRPWIERAMSGYRVYLTNAVQCGVLRPPAEYQDACAPRLADELDTVKPDAVLLLGDVAQNVYKKVGSPYLCDAAPHPSVVVRRLSSRRRWQDQINAAWKRLQGRLRGEQEALPSDLEFPGKVVIAIDTEYKERAHDGFDLCVVHTGEGATCFRHDRPDDLGLLTERLRRCDEIVFHHAVNDLVALGGRGVHIPEGQPIHCTLTAQGIIHPGASRDLKVMANLRGWTYPIIDIGAWKRGKVEEQTAIDYCANDALSTLGVWQDLRDEALLHRLYRDTYQPLLRVLSYQMSSIPVDLGRVRMLIAEFEGKQHKAEERLAAIAGLNWYSTKQVSEFLRAQGIVLPLTDQGNPKSDEETLKELLPTSLDLKPTIEDVLVIRECRKILGTYLYPWQRYGAATTVYDPTGARTGRMSSRDGNVQNIPDLLRQCLIAGPGRMWVGGDLVQAEFAAAAWLSQDDLMLEATAGDFHTANATVLLGRPPKDKAERDGIKPVSFALLYLGSDWTIRKNLKKELGVEISKADAQRFFVNFWERYTGYMQYIDHLKAQAARGEVLSPFDRRYQTRASKDLEDARILVNTLIQGVVGDLTARALLRCARAGVRPGIQVHDYIGAFEDVQGAGEAAEIMRREMVNDIIPIRVEVTVRERWAEPKVPVTA